MKKLMVLAASLLMAGSAFAAGAGARLVAPNATFAFGAPGIASGPTTTNNDDACDISVAPVATLLLPYFEVDFRSPATTARTTLFTITNTSRLPQIAHVVIWTDWSFAALDFNIFLTGYDVQSINLYDVFNRGVIAPVSSSAAGTSISNVALSPVGTSPPNQPNAAPATNISNPNHNHSGGASDVTNACVSLPGNLGPYLADLQQVFTTGVAGVIIGSGCGSFRLGGTHTNAIGYITVDVDSTCSTSLPGPIAGGTYSGSEILFDNVLIGDYQDVNPNSTTGNYAGGNPMVHIRAIPEGGPVGSNPGTNLPFTFYDRYNFGGNSAIGGPISVGTQLTNGNNRQLDRRQPLPAVFAARWIQGGTTGFNTNYKIWREGITGPNSTTCTATVPSANSALAIVELVRFDEHENSNSVAPPNVISPPPPSITNVLPETSSTSTSSSIFPGLTLSGDLGGWMYMNLNNNFNNVTGVYSNPALDNPVGHPNFVGRPSQNWTIISMFAEGRYSVDFDAAWLGNGCSPAVLSGTTIGPIGGVPVCPAGSNPALCVPGVAPYTGTNTTP
jgi:hypothetical protein